MKINDYMRRKRVASGFSQAALARKIGYGSAQYVSNWERGVCGVPVDKISRLCRVLDLDTDMVFNLCVEDFKKDLADRIGL